MSEKNFIIQNLKSDTGEVQDARMIGPDSGGSITVDDSISNSSENPVQNKVISTALGDKADSSDLSGYEPKASVVTDLSSTSITLASAADNTIYEYGELSALTIAAIANPGEFSITFTSGSTATVLTVPNTMIMPDGFAVEANTRYEINCKDGYALVAGWAVSA
jgi:hypothetical protein